MTRWRVFQLVDSAFPSGAFAHSAGLEAMLRVGELRELGPVLDAVVLQTGRGALPFVGAAFDAPA